MQPGESSNLLNRRQIPIRLAGRRREFISSGCVAAVASIFGSLVIACAVMSLASHGRANEVARPDQPDLEAQLTELKAKTAELVASARPRLDALSPQRRLAAPPAIWRVPGTLTQFQDCTDCPQLVVIPAGEFTMGSPPSDGAAAAQHRVTIAHPFAVSKFEITFSEWDACATDLTWRGSAGKPLSRTGCCQNPNGNTRRGQGPRRDFRSETPCLRTRRTTTAAPTGQARPR